MNDVSPKSRLRWRRALELCGILALVLVSPMLRDLQAGERSPGPSATRSHPTVYVVKGTAQVSGVRAQEWRSIPASQWHSVEAGNRLRTGERSQAVIRLTDQSLLRLGELTTIEITAPTAPAERVGFSLWRGLMYFFSRQNPDDLRWRTPAASGAVLGTEFALNVDGEGVTKVTVLEGEVEVRNTVGQVGLKAGEQAVVARDQAPQKSAVLDLPGVVQWCVYYPGVLEVEELALDAAAQPALKASLDAWRSGDLLQAEAQYPQGRQASSDAEQVYAAALALAVGQVEKAQGTLGTLDTPLARAVRQVTAVAQGRPWSRSTAPASASEWVAESYYQQSRMDLKAALQAARAATDHSPGFGFAWERLAEMEFSQGKTAAAEAALRRALELSPRNPQAWVLSGFLALARDQPARALTAFDRATALDGALANAWLGKGLCRFRQRQLEAGLADLRMAAALEPSRSLLRSYLGKAYQHEASYLRNFGRRRELLAKADNELSLARRSDPMDPTPWLYAALLKYQQYRTAEAIEDLERSVELNDNRRLYRSRLLLDQDQAVRNAQLANVYKSAGMAEVSRSESVRAVAYDYANYSAHLNLAVGLDALRDPTRFNLRHESEWYNEHLLASLLAPVDGGTLSRNLSQQEYSRAFVADYLGGVSTTEYLSTGEVRERFSQYGRSHSTAYAVDVDYHHMSGIRLNNDLSRLEWSTRLKQQFGPQDAVLLITEYQDYSAGDHFQYYDPALADANYRLEELQQPVVLAGYHHEWSPGIHTLLLGGRLTDTMQVTDPSSPRRLILPQNLSPLSSVVMDLDYRNDMEVYTGELCQIVQGDRHTDVLGVRLQSGDFDAWSVLSNPPARYAKYWPQPLRSRGDGDFSRVVGYLYHTWKVRENLLLTLGGCFDRLESPLNYRRAPLTAGTREAERWSPKGALSWSPAPNVTVRAAYARALGGASYDESVRLEPTLLGGFSQSHRSLISESLVGSVEAPVYEMMGAGMDLKFANRTYLTLEAARMTEKLDRVSGAIYLDQFSGSTWTAPFSEQLGYREYSISAVANQVVETNWFLDLSYAFNRAELDRNQALLPDQPARNRFVSERSDLQTVKLGLAYRAFSGLFGRAEGAWYIQDNQSNVANRSGEAVPQVNVWVGYQFPLRHGEVAIGLLNLTDDDYRLYPLNYYWELPRERIVCLRLSWNF